MNNELQVKNFIIDLDEPFSLADLIVKFRAKGGNDDMLALKMVSTLLDENELFYEEVTTDEEGYPVKEYLTKKAIEKMKNAKRSR